MDETICTRGCRASRVYESCDRVRPISPAVERVVLKALSKDQHQRYAHVQECVYFFKLLLSRFSECGGRRRCSTLVGVNNEATSYLNASSNQDAARCRSGRDHLLSAVHDQHGVALPEELRGTDVATWLQGNTTTISLALTLVPFAGIAFLWFIGVVRSRLEDQFFSTVFFGSGLLFLAMMFASAAIAGGMLSSYAIEADTLVKSGVVTFGRAVMYTISNVYGVRMAGVFMVSLATMWIRTHVMPRVFVISVFILVIRLHGGRAEAEGVIGSQETSQLG